MDVRTVRAAPLKNKSKGKGPRFYRHVAPDGALSDLARCVRGAGLLPEGVREFSPQLVQRFSSAFLEKSSLVHAFPGGCIQFLTSLESCAFCTRSSRGNEALILRPCYRSEFRSDRRTSSLYPRRSDHECREPGAQPHYNLTQYYNRPLPCTGPRIVVA